jgi:deoxyribose-phosphate aldolase
VWPKDQSFTAQFGACHRFSTANSHMSKEQLIRSITDEILRKLNTTNLEQALCECRTDCMHKCPDGLRRLVECGAERFGIHFGAPPVSNDLSQYIDHTLLKPDGTEAQIRQLCKEAAQFRFATVCVNPTWVKLCAQLLRGTGVGVCTVAGFPLGATPPDVKAYEARRAIFDGANEIDMVINVGLLKSEHDPLVFDDICEVARVTHEGCAQLKVIIEAALLTTEEKVKACTLAKQAGADYVKTSTGFGPGGATAEDVALMRRVVGKGIGVKAAGGIRDLAAAEQMIAAGATRVGASAGVKIAQEAASRPPLSVS